MQITISVSHTFEDATLFAAFAPELKAFLDKFFSGAPSLPAAPETRGMVPRESANVIAPPAVRTPDAQPAPILGAAGTFGQTTTLGDAGGGSTALAGKTVSVAAEGQVFAREQVRELIEGLNEAIADGATISVVEAPPKRKRRTKAEMAAARASGAVAPLPNAGSFGGPATTSAPQPAAEPDPFDPFNPMTPPTSKPTAVPASGIAYVDVKQAFAPLLMHENSEPHVLEVIGRFGLTKLNECMDKPELWAPVRDALLQLQKTLGVAA